jgi:hypothetical protein
VTGAWYESSFPDGGYVAELGLDNGVMLSGVFAATADALYLQGIVSPTGPSTTNLTSTKLTYSPWVKVMKFPLTAGASWSTTATVSGTYDGVLIGLTVLQSEQYDATVDRVGTMKTPYATFPVLRVRTVMSRTINFVHTLTSRTYNYVTDCFGTVATVTSTDNETSTEFTSVKEARRLAP